MALLLWVCLLLVASPTQSAHWHHARLISRITRPQNTARFASASRIVDLRGGAEKNTALEKEAKVSELRALGDWSKSEAELALDASRGNVAEAHEALASGEEAEVMASVNAGMEELTKLGYSEDVALEVLRDNFNNATAAKEVLRRDAEENAARLEDEVARMVVAGWNADDARAKLLDDLDQWRTTGGVSKAEDAAPPPPPPPPSRPPPPQRAAAAGAAPNAKGPAAPAPPKVNLSEVLFNITDPKSFQKLVIDSPVPVVVDVYADWCQPCKALAPILDQVAANAGGQLRVGKINSDECKGLAEALKVKGLPTVLVFNRGACTDSFVGVPPREQLQEFFMRAVGAPFDAEGKPIPPRREPARGFGRGNDADAKDADEHQHTAKDLQAIGQNVGVMAGQASLGFARKEELEMKTEELMGSLEEEVLFGAEYGGPSMQEVGKALSAYIGNLERDMSNPRFRNISTGSAFYLRHVAPFPSAVAILESVGFRLAKVKTPQPQAAAAAAAAGGGGGGGGEAAPPPRRLLLKHRNAAPLVVVGAALNKWLSPAATMQRSRDKLQSQVKARAIAAAQQQKAEREKEGDANAEEPMTSSSPSAQDLTKCDVAVRVPGRRKGDPFRSLPTRSFDSSSSLSEVVKWARQHAEAPGDFKGEGDEGRAATPPPLRVVVRAAGVAVNQGEDDDGVLNKSLLDLGLPPSASIVLTPAPPSSSSSHHHHHHHHHKQEPEEKLSGEAAGAVDPFAGRKDKAAKLGKDEGKVHTMLSTGVLKANTNKAMEYENGDGTVYEANIVEEEDDEEVDEEDSGGNVAEDAIEHDSDEEDLVDAKAEQAEEEEGAEEEEEEEEEEEDGDEHEEEESEGLIEEQEREHENEKHQENSEESDEGNRQEEGDEEEVAIDVEEEGEEEDKTEKVDYDPSHTGTGAPKMTDDKEKLRGVAFDEDSDDIDINDEEEGEADSDSGEMFENGDDEDDDEYDEMDEGDAYDFDDSDEFEGEEFRDAHDEDDDEEEEDDESEGGEFSEGEHSDDEW